MAWSRALMVLVLGITVRSQNSKCEKMASLATLEDHNTVVETSLRLLSGTWVSEGCETRPGPEYVLRSYTFDMDGNYYLVQHHYYDDSCSSPQFSVFSHGRLQLRTSLMQPEAASGIMKVTNISVIPQDNNAAREMDRVVAMECPGQEWKTWRRYEEHVVFDSAFEEKRKTYNLWEPRYVLNNHHDLNRNIHHSYGDISCLGALKWVFNELRLLKIQLRPIMEKLKPRKYPRQMRAELLLGDIHTNYRERENHIPTSFQLPLIKQVKGEMVSINRHSYVIKSGAGFPSSTFTNNKTPPHLIEKPHLPPYIYGEWTSTRCEVRPLGLYLTRRFSFYSEDSTWIGEHKFYSDPFCKIPKFIVTAAGHFTLTVPNKELKGTTNEGVKLHQRMYAAWNNPSFSTIRYSETRNGL
ncbi:unnamed protein product [Brassicogethes aeneus]|uniref:APCDD1 domain-containing protein n=1 Tax=Brassicogethes aeneus TaxID=1431903 RepID=A0A9P0FCZ9_BRAAE|nr:unnamed protein product [Brassicogethes aeneus]